MDRILRPGLRFRRLLLVGKIREQSWRIFELDSMALFLVADDLAQRAINLEKKIGRRLLIELGGTLGFT